MVETKYVILGILTVLAFTIGGREVYLKATTDSPNYDVCKSGSYGTWSNVTEIIYHNSTWPQVARYHCDVEDTFRYCRKTTKTWCYFVDEIFVKPMPNLKRVFTNWTEEQSRTVWKKEWKLIWRELNQTWENVTTKLVKDKISKQVKKSKIIGYNISYKKTDTFADSKKYRCCSDSDKIICTDRLNPVAWGHQKCVIQSGSSGFYCTVDKEKMVCDNFGHYKKEFKKELMINAI